MTNQKSIELSKLLNGLNKCTQLQYSGRLTFKNSQGKEWSLYYRLGQIVWATGGSHPYRRLCRCIAQNCPQVDMNIIQVNADNLSIEPWDYFLLENLYKCQKIKQEQLNAIVENTITEVLFDLAQQVNTYSWSCNRNHKVILEAPMIATSAQMSLKQMQESWYNWVQAGLEIVSPNLAPVLRKPQELQQQVSSFVYNNFVNLFNGKYTLWDLAVKMKQGVLPVTRSLLPYINKGITELVEIADLPLPGTKVKTEVAKPKNEIAALKFQKFYHLSVSTPLETNHPANVQILKNKTSKAPLIACVDDSPQACKILEEIITANGLRFMGIQEPVQALPTLIQNKPDLIFLDLIMPVMNGYEICAQLRRSSFLSKTPVVILTGSDRLLDPVRSRVFGATEFMTKPVVPAQVIAMIDRYVKATLQADNSSNLAICSS
ncbi:response regulator receiver protein [Calothrix sp. NIES-2100]|uniref:response regulator n=1 Tax=Calothrix sp. NIES-2100 TaxID=1954172 RepID=UPI000B5DEDA1|nr:response regulator receiver protein [Calothrix sp. NIES-2100]